MTNVTAIVADGIATQVGMLTRQILLPWWQMELPLGHFILILVLCCLLEPNPIYETDGICLYFCLGMG